MKQKMTKKIDCECSTFAEVPVFCVQVLVWEKCMRLDTYGPKSGDFCESATTMVLCKNFSVSKQGLFFGFGIIFSFSEPKKIEIVFRF